MELSIEKKIAVVTGASRGLGRAVAEALAKEGANLAICSRNKRDIEEASEAIRIRYHVEVLPVECDVTKLSDIERLKNAVKNRFKTCHILFTNADGPPSGALDDFRSEDYEKAIRLNLLSTIQLVYAFIPFMKRQKWGRVIASTSSNVRCLLPQFPLSNVSRIGIVAFIKTLAHEFAPFNVTANVLAPGLFLTEPTIDFIKDCSKRKRIKYSEALREIQGTIPAQTIGRPEDYGALAAFLASGWASYITGETILIDGGQHCLVM